MNDYMKLIQKWREVGKARLKEDADDPAGQVMVRYADELEAAVHAKRGVVMLSAIALAAAIFLAEMGYELEEDRQDRSMYTATAFAASSVSL